jgi:hypothetical protein
MFTSFYFHFGWFQIQLDILQGVKSATTRMLSKLRGLWIDMGSKLEKERWSVWGLPWQAVQMLGWHALRAAHCFFCFLCSVLDSSWSLIVLLELREVWTWSSWLLALISSLLHFHPPLPDQVVRFQYRKTSKKNFQHRIQHKNLWWHQTVACQ